MVHKAKSLSGPPVFGHGKNWSGFHCFRTEGGVKVEYYFSLNKSPING